MNNLYWYTSSYKSHIPFSRLTIASKGFSLVEEKFPLPNFKLLIFKKGDSYIQVILYESEIHEATYLFVQECNVKERFIDKLQLKAFSGFHHDMFITDDEPEKMISQIEASLKYFEEDEILHIYGQQMWHDDAYIVGNRAALQRLRDEIDQALQYGEKKDVFSPKDNEGFDLFVTCVDDQFDWEQLDSPYHDPEIFERHKRPVEAFKYYKISE